MESVKRQMASLSDAKVTQKNLSVAARKNVIIGFISRF